MMILTTPFIAPIVFKLGGIDLGGGVVPTVLIEAVSTTPPVGSTSMWCRACEDAAQSTR